MDLRKWYLLILQKVFRKWDFSWVLSIYRKVMVATVKLLGGRPKIAPNKLINYNNKITPMETEERKKIDFTKYVVVKPLRIKQELLDIIDKRIIEVGEKNFNTYIIGLILKDNNIEREVKVKKPKIRRKKKKLEVNINGPQDMSKKKDNSHKQKIEIKEQDNKEANISDVFKQKNTINKVLVKNDNSKVKKEKDSIKIEIEKKQSNDKAIAKENIDILNNTTKRYIFNDRLCTYKNFRGDICTLEVTDEMIELMSLPGVNSRTFLKFDNPYAFKITQEYIDNNI